MPSSIELAVQAFREQRYPAAIAFFEELRRSQPTNMKIVFSLAQAYLAAGQPSDAREAFLAVANAEDERLAAMARQALESLGPAEPEPSTEAHPPSSSVYCPDCGEAIPDERANNPWCACGWGLRKAKGDDCLYVSHLKAFATHANLTIELKMRGDMYALDAQVWIKHLSDQMTLIDPRQVFRVDQGLPYLRRSDLDKFMPKVDDRAVFRLGVKGTVGKLLTWEALVEKVKEVVPNPSSPPEGGLRTVLAEYRILPREILEQVEQEVGPGRLGSGLLAAQACTLQDLLESGLGAQRVFAPSHHQGNHLGRILLEAGVLSEVELKQALITQIKRPRALQEILRAQVPLPAMRKALDALDRLPSQGPETDRLGEVLFAMGAVSRTELTQALQERAKRNKLMGKLMLERGMVTEEALIEALKRQELKREARSKVEVPLGSVLADLQACDLKAVARALVMQIRDPRPLGEILVSQGAVSPEQLIAGFAEQERRLEALVEKRLPAALKKAKLSEIDHPAKKSRKRERIPLDDEAEGQGRKRRRRPSRKFKRGESEGAEAFRLPPARVLIAAGLSLVVVLGGISLLAGRPKPQTQVAATATPGVPGAVGLTAAGGPQAAGGASQSAQTSKRPAFSSLTAANVVNVDMDQVVERLEKGDPNPLGEGFLGASGSLPAGLEAMAQKKVAELPAGGATKAGSARPQAKALPVEGQFLSAEGLGGLDAEDPAPLPRAAGTNGKPSAAVQAGVGLMAKGNLPAAEKAFQAALAKSPQSAEVMHRLGNTQRRMGKAKAAELTLSKAVQLSPGQPQLWADLGAVRLEKGDLPGAVQAYAKAAKAAPRDAAMHNRHAFALLKQGRLPDAHKAFETALKTDPGNPNSHFNLGILKAKSDGKAARAHLVHASDGFYELVDSRMAYGEALKAQGDPAGAFGSYRGALRANTLLAQVHMELGKLDLQERDAASAKENFTTAKQAYLANAIAHDQMGLALAAMKEPKKAVAEWVLATKIAPFYAPPYAQLGAYYRAQGKQKEANRYYASAQKATVKARQEQLSVTF